MPRDFRLIRVLSIVHWYFPDNLKFLTHLALEEFDTSCFNFKQQIEINIYLSSKENTSKYLFLTERYSGNEIFGNILGNDLRDFLRSFKITKRFYPKPRKKVWRRGPKDKGSRRISSFPQRLYESDVYSDVWINEEYEKYLKKGLLIQHSKVSILKYLENFESE